MDYKDKERKRLEAKVDARLRKTERGKVILIRTPERHESWMMKMFKENEKGQR